MGSRVCPQVFELGKSDDICPAEVNFGKEIQALNKWTQSALSAAANYFEKLLEAKAKNLLKLLPAVTILNNPKILTTKELQVAILDNPERDNVAGAVVSLHKLHESAKTLNSKITNFLPKETLAELKSTLDHGKLNLSMPCTRFFPKLFQNRVF